MTVVDTHEYETVVRVLTGPVLTFALGVSMIILGVATRGAMSDSLPLRDAIVVFSFMAGSTAMLSALLYPNNMRRAHVVVATVLFGYAVVRGVSLGVSQFRTNPFVDRTYFRLLTESTPPWIWLVVGVFSLIVVGIVLDSIAQDHER